MGVAHPCVARLLASHLVTLQGHCQYCQWARGGACWWLPSPPLFCNIHRALNFQASQCRHHASPAYIKDMYFVTFCPTPVAPDQRVCPPHTQLLPTAVALPCSVTVSAASGGGVVCGAGLATPSTAGYNLVKRCPIFIIFDRHIPEGCWLKTSLLCPTSLNCVEYECLCLCVCVCGC